LSLPAVKFAERNHAFLLFIPQFIENTLQAFAERYGRYQLVEYRIFAVATCQLVIGYQGVEVVDVVVPDVASKPMEHPW
jgi:hypothetical protein